MGTACSDKNLGWNLYLVDLQLLRPDRNSRLQSADLEGGMVPSRSIGQIGHPERHHKIRSGKLWHASATGYSTPICGGDTKEQGRLVCHVCSHDREEVGSHLHGS